MRPEQPNNQNDLVRQSIRGDRHAQYQLYKQYNRAMFNICLRILNHREDAEDILQEAFASAFNKLESYKGESTFGAWLKRIVVNHCLNFIKKKKLAVTLLDRTEHIKEEEPIDDSHINYNIEKIKKAMTQLSDGYRTVLSLFLFEGYSHDEIGEILNCSAGTSKSQYHRAKARLINLMQNTNHG